MHPSRSLWTTCAIALAATVVMVSTVFAAATPNWNIKFEKDIKWLNLMATGHLVASTDLGLIGINPETGEVAWTMEDLKKIKEDRFDPIPYTQFAVIQKGKGFLGAHNKMIVIDYVSGEEKWNSDKLGIQSSMGQFILPEIRALMVYGVHEKAKKWIQVVDLETGDLMWENKDFFKKRNPQVFQLSASKQTLIGNQEPVFDTDETMITFMNKKAIRKWNAKTGELIWETEIKCSVAPALKYGYCPMLLSNDVATLYVAAQKSVFAVRPTDGSLVWEKPEKLKGLVYQISILPQGILVKGGPNPEGEHGDPFMMLLDKATGKKLWKKEFKKLKKSTNYVVDGDHALVLSDKKLYSINIADGEYKEVAKDITFEGKETPGSLQKRDDGLFISSSNNLMMLSMTGDQKWHSYHKAPGGSLFGKIAFMAAVTAINIGSTMDGLSRAQYNASQSVTGRGSAKYKLMDASPYMSKRFRATKNTFGHKYILTKVEADGVKGPGLVKVSKTTGEVVGQVVLKDKKPMYEVDEIENKVFYVKDKKEIFCYDL